MNDKSQNSEKIVGKEYYDRLRVLSGIPLKEEKENI